VYFLPTYIYPQHAGACAMYEASELLEVLGLWTWNPDQTWDIYQHERR
jgi:hypothetical protein